jgi:threonine dehydrogenase-like Zn-dependent dehydrogenase
LRVYRGIGVDAEGKFLHERVPFQLPTPNGYSMVGEVVEVGSRVQGFQPGERVFVPSPHGQLAAVDARLAVKLPDQIPSEQAGFLNILEVGHIALRRGNPEPGENVAVIGQGVIGLSVLAYARLFGMRTAAVDFVEHRLQIAREMGADLTVDAGDDRCVRRVVEFFEGAGADLVVECASRWAAIETGMQLAAPEARIVVAARHTDRPAFNPVGHPHLGKKLTLLTSYGYPAEGQRWDRRRSIALTLELLSQGKLHIAPMITHRFGWEELPEVYRRLDAGDVEMAGVVLDWNDR